MLSFFYLRGFSILNWLKDKIRNLLSPKMTSAIVRLHYSDDTVYTLDVHRLTRMWTSNGHTLCSEPSNWQKKKLGLKEPDNEIDQTMVDLEFLYGGEQDAPQPIQRNTDTCMIIINKVKGEAITAVRNGVKLHPLSPEGVQDDQVFKYT